MNTVSLISLTDVETNIGKEQFFVYDCTSQNHYKRYHIPTAIFLGQFYGQSSLPSNKNARLAFYSYNSKSNHGLQASKMAIQMGYKKVYHMRAGIEGWLQKMAKEPLITNAKSANIWKNRVENRLYTSEN